MKYMGSKNRYAKEILPLVLKDRDNKPFIDCFCGGLGISDKVDGIVYANDNNYYLIEMWKAIQTGWEPPRFVSEEEYKRIRDYKCDFDPALVGFVSFGCSYSGKEWGGYARGKDNKGRDRNYCEESRKNVLKQAPNIKHIVFSCLNYDEVNLPENSILYCDPPYLGTTKYKAGQFNYGEYYNWLRIKKREGHMVFCSEYQMPQDFKCIWSKIVNNTLVKDTGSKQGIEKLFTLE